MSRALFYLASASPRRLALLQDEGLRPTVVPATIAEIAHPGESALRMVLRLAEEKARAAATGFRDDAPHGVVLGADTAVVLDGEVMGKPRDAGHAREMLIRLSGRQHEVLTGVFLLRTDDGRSIGAVDRTTVEFHDHDPAIIEAYVAGGEPMDKAGGYGIQGDGGRLVAGTRGSFNNVVGLPVERLDGWLGSLGYRLDDFR